MKRQIFIILTITLIPLILCGQIETVKTSVYFDNDRFELRVDGKQNIDITIDTLVQDNIFKIDLFGNTDNSADSLYNLKLSDNRTNSVKSYLISKGFKENIITTNYFGEERPIASNENNVGKQKNRRVDIIFFYKQHINSIQYVDETLPKRITLIDTCQGRDTIISLPQGTQLVFNRREFLEIKNCLEFTEIYNSQDILVNGLSLMDTSGFPIASCGMLKVTMKPGCTNRSCFNVPVKVRFPIPKDKECDYCGRKARVWDITVNGGWVPVQGKKSEVKIIKVKGQIFYQFELFCPNFWKNCDCKPKGKKMKFKTKRNFKIVNIIVTFDCPTAVLELKPKKKKNIAKTKIPCWKGNKTVIATIIDKKGDTLILKQQPLNDLTKRTMFSKCKKIKGEKIGYRFGIFPIAKRQFYRKYIIKHEQLTEIN